MSIKTDELQRLTSVLGTDSILMANSAGGTTQLPIEDLARFLAEQDNAVRTALSSKAALSAQEALEKTAVPGRSITLTAEELPDHIASLPRLLTEDLYINVSGTLTETLDIANFYGSGSIRIRGNYKCAVRNISISNCTVPIELQELTIGASQLPDKMLDIVSVTDSKDTYIMSCTISGGPELRGVYAGVAAVRLYNSSIKNCADALLVAGGGLLAITSTGTAVYEGNTAGAYVYHGGIVLLSGQVPDLLGGDLNRKQGGIIVKGNGTLL